MGTASSWNLAKLQLNNKVSAEGSDPAADKAWLEVVADELVLHLEDSSTLVMLSQTAADLLYAALSHNHAASAITSGTLAHERGGLEADVSAYSGLLKISGGSTSQAVAGTDYTSPTGTENLSGKTITNSTIGTANHASGKFTTLENTGAYIHNEAGGDVDARWEGDTDANLLFLDASTDRVGIGTNAPAQKLDVNGVAKALALMLAASTELTLSSGAVTVTQGFHTIDTEGDASSGNLDTLSGGAAGQLLVLRANNGGRSVVVTTSGNIVTPDGSSITLDETYKALLLIYDGDLSKWVVVGGTGAGGGGGTVDIEDEGSPEGAAGTIDFVGAGVSVTYAGAKATVTIPGGAGGSDTDAIHDNVASEISAITEKTFPDGDDLLLVEDSEDSNNKKRLLVKNLWHYIKVSDRKSNGTNGGTFTQGAWRTRDINTKDDDTGTDCSILKLAFTSGGTYQVVVGDTITGATSGATATVFDVELTSGSWAGGDAAGNLWLNGQTGTFAAENLNVGANSNVATIAADSTKNQIRLKAGTYHCSIRCPSFRVNNNMARLYNITASAVILNGSNTYSLNSSNAAMTDSWIVGRFVLSVISTLEIQHQCVTTQNTNGFGGTTSISGQDEIYTTAEFERLAG